MRLKPDWYPVVGGNSALARCCLKLEAHVLYPCVQSGGGMRAKIIFAMLVGLLFCGLATFEITELANLSDDTSNDFLAFDSHQAPSAIVDQSLEQSKTNPSTDDGERPRVRRWLEADSRKGCSPSALHHENVTLPSPELRLFFLLNK